MDYKDYYKILGVERTAGEDDIKRAYRKLAKQLHPDRNPGDSQAEERFKEINEAYQVLSDPQKRARYDQLGDSYTNWKQNGAPGNFNWGDWTSSQRGATQVNMNEFFGEEGMFSDFFRTIFGGTSPAGGPRRGHTRAPQNYQQSVTISLREAYTGTTRLLQGQDRRLEVKIPAGARNGTKVRVHGGGLADPNGQAGDLYLVMDIAPDPAFEREGDDLHTQVNIDVFTAILGGEVKVNPLDGQIILTIPAGTQPEQVFRVSGRGMPNLKSPQTRGDLYVRVKVQIPRQLSSKQKSLLEEATQQK